jgi:hypothetical protein
VANVTQMWHSLDVNSMLGRYVLYIHIYIHVKDIVEDFIMPGVMWNNII